MSTSQQQNFYAQHLIPLIGADAARLPNRAVTGFALIPGRLYSNELMIVGRAVNGWGKEDGMLPIDLATPPSAEDYAEKIFSFSQPDADECPMSWISDYWANPSNPDSGYNTKKSAFWRVIRRVVAESQIASADDDTWASHLVWSNLYKIAPWNGGNPGGRLRKIQLNACISILQQEINLYRPRRLLLLTGLGWAEPFLRDIAPTFTPTQACRYLEAKAKVLHPDGSTTKLVVAAHPQGKRESIWVEEVIQAFRE